ncbi:hypothetical protein CPB85DRAFT_1443891 [Mucidula mucida]|nr:hypothetical protein CPB85DRAFT_1443891 [Mucidula mucida]
MSDLLLNLLPPPPPPPDAPRRRRRRRHMNSPGPSPHDLQSHLYQSFLDGKTTDVALRISGSWHAIYHLHRVVLIQSGFFRSLFTAGFAESSSPRSPRQESTPEELQVVFDDYNITRAAFEVCIAWLYGGGPPLHVAPALRPTLTHPLTPGFPYFSESQVPSGHQPATPQFLLSLLATSIYLSIPTLASQALSAIYGTTGPYTVIRYLNFALGKSISLDDQASAVGLEAVAEMLDSASDTDDDLVAPSLSRYPSSLKGKGRRSPSPEVLSASPNGSFERISPSSDTAPAETLSFHYGAISDKIGEAATAWLSRWGPDILVYEEQLLGNVLNVHPSIVKQRKRAKTIPGGHENVAAETDSRPPNCADAKIPLIWRRGGLSPLWVKALISSDSFFVKHERERYEFAKRVVDLRRSQCGVDEQEERVWDELFSKGIYYCNMITDEIISLSTDICPTTQRPYVPLSVLQSANWAHTLLRHQIIARPSSPSSNSPTKDNSSPKSMDKDLGLAVPKSAYTSEDTPLYPVPTDGTLRIGERGGPSSEGKGISMEQLFAHSHAPYSHSSPDIHPDPSPITFNESTFFGLMSKPTGSPNATYTHFPPFRFSIEFFDINRIGEKDRLHSQTIWYAGNLFNVYLQVVKKKGSSISGQQGPQAQQLGIYVSRQSTVDRVPMVSALNPAVARSTMEMQTRVAPKENVSNGVLATPTIHHHASISHLSASASTSSARPTTPITPSAHSTTPVTESRPGTSSSLPSYTTTFPTPSYRDEFGFPYSLPYKVPGVSPVQPYRDSRPNVMAYFMVHCASPTGTFQTRFSSGPDQFKVGQSWGWKSGSLKGEDEIPPGNEGDGDVQASKVSLRATVILGVV